jgi:pyridoxamine 5'-phosphate oxidase
VIYTNLDSRKGEELAANPQAALLFHWKSLRRQVRIEGPVEAVSAAEADAYFASRSRDSQLGAWASDQSRPLDRRATFEARVEEMRARFEGRDVPRPPRWSGFRVLPERIEFWQDRAFRLHERRLFVRSGEDWLESLLYP